MVTETCTQPRLGVPRSILHYEFDGVVERFLRELGFDVELSPPTNREIFLAGKRLVIDELCFPIKVFVGHAAYLVGRSVDRVVIPVIVGHESNRVFPCHPRSRLADIVCALGVCQRDQLLMPAFRYDHRGLTRPGFLELGWMLGVAEPECIAALERASNDPRPATPDETQHAGPSIGLVGRPYVVQDAWISNDIIERLRALECRVMTESDGPPLGYAPEGTGLHFALAARTVALAKAWDRDPAIDGILFLLPFNCGPDGDIARHLNHSIEKPMLTLVLDELQSNAGLVTRLEAFIDMIDRSAVVPGGVVQ